MIVPAGWHEGMTDDEAVAGYAEIGISEATARTFIAVLRDPPADPRFPID